MRLFELVYYGRHENVESDLYCHRDNAIKGALKYIKTKMGLHPAEIEIEDEVRYVGSRINFYMLENGQKINSVHIEVVNTIDEE